MGGLSNGRMGRALRRVVWFGLSVAGLSGHPPNRLSAQVGYDPDTSPFRDIPLRAGPMVFVGYLAGDRGIADAGVSDALILGARYEIPAGSAVQFQFSVAYLRGDRFIIDPTADSTSPARRTGPVTSSLLLTDIGVQLRLTGAKMWNRLVPYIGAAGGLVRDIDSPGDTTGSGYRFGTKITLSGGTGVRWYPTQRIAICADLRAQLWRLRHPISFHTPAPGDSSRVIPLTKDLRDWTTHPWISVGVGWTF